MIELGPDEALTYSPEWLKNVRRRRCAGNAMIATTGDPEPELLADLDGERVGRAVPQEIVADPACSRSPRTPSTGAASARRPRAGRSRSSASPTSSGSGRRSPSACGSTSRIRSRPGASTSRGSTQRTAQPQRAPRRRAPLPRPRHRPHRRAAAERALDGRSGRDGIGDPLTSRTCRPRRSSPRPTRDARRGRSARRGRFRSPARSSAVWS